MKPMSTKCKVINVLIMNIPVALFISLTAQLLAIAAGEAPGFSFPLLGMNFCLAYVISFIVGMCLPAVPWGISFARACKAEPGSLKFGLLVNVIVNLVYVLVNCLLLTWFNVCLLGKAPFWPAYPLSVLKMFIPIYIVGYIVSFLWNQPAEKIARKICHEE